MLTVLHLTGSPTSEFFADLSRLYAADCLQAVADPARYRFLIAYVAPDGSWRLPADLSPQALAAAPPMDLPAALAELAERDVDVAVPQLFCLPGMTTYRALLDALSIPYVGNRPDVMAIGADKAKAKALVAAGGVRTPRGELVRSAGEVTLAPPAVVKPVDADNSSGVTLVTSPDGYPGAVREALRHSPAALVERFVPLGREVRCGIVVAGDELVCLPLEEYAVHPDSKPIRDAADKLARADDGELGLVAKTAAYSRLVDARDPVTEAVWEAARRCHQALGCRDYSLFDFRIDPDGTPWFLEAGLYWSFARQSVLSTMAAAAGLDLREVFDRLLRDAAARAPGALPVRL